MIPLGPGVTGPLLHLTTPADWRAALAVGMIAPPSLADIGFVHLSTSEQVALPATRLFAGRDDVLLLVLDAARLGVEVQWEPGLPTDPASMRFPHAYGSVPTCAVLAVLPYRPRPDGTFDAPVLPPVDAAGRLAALQPSLLRRVATSEIPVTGGVAVLTAPVPGSFQHNQLLIDGHVDAATLVADAERTLGGAGSTHRRALMTGAHLATTAAGLADRGWQVEHLACLAAPAGGARSGLVGAVDLATLRPTWMALWRCDLPDASDAEIAGLIDGVGLEEAVTDLRHLAVHDGGAVVASCLLKIDGATALLTAMGTDPAHRGRGHGDALVTDALALAAGAGCDLVVLHAAADDWTRHWYGRRGFVEVGQSWTAGRPR